MFWADHRSNFARSKSSPSFLSGRYIFFGSHATRLSYRSKLIVYRGNKNGPPILRNLSNRLSKRLSPWQTVVITLLWLYIARNFAKIVGLESPEPLANLYTRSYFRATWVTTALDAGFWTAMKIRSRWLRDLASMVFTIYYLVAAEQADEKVRKVRGLLTVDHLRVSWHKSTTPYLSLLTRVLRPKLTRYPPRAIRIPRPASSSYKEPANAWLYFDGPLSALKNHTRVVLDIPGGGFVAMTPRHHEDKLLGWAGKLEIPVLSLDYKKAPEYPYPHALNEAYDVYHSLVASRGRCIGLSGATTPRIIMTGDSAGGNIATGAVLMILQSASTDAHRYADQETLPAPEGLVLIYPGLDMNIGNWMSDEQMALIQDRRTRTRNRNVLRRKSEDYYKLAPDTPHPSDDEDKTLSPTLAPIDSSIVTGADKSTTPLKPLTNAELDLASPSTTLATQSTSLASSKPKPLKTRLAMSSMISYFNDRILTPEMMRAMIILYVGPHARPDFSTDFLLSPLLAPEALLAKFPKTCFLTGERDPLVDDTVIFAGRLRQAKHNLFIQRKELGLLKSKDTFDEREHVEVTLIPGISHGFLQFVSVFPEGWNHIFRVARWIEEIFDNNEARAKISGATHDSSAGDKYHVDGRHHRRMPTESSGDEDRPLEMSALPSSNVGKTQPEDGEDGYFNHRRRPQPQRLRTGAGGKRRRDANGHAREKSMVSLASEEDLLGRRMKGLAGGLMGMSSEGTETP
ncbi:MAG: hypothetical protein LQ348_002415 [Seirophora lacunosa]|nr:MAG: hypothetical protein LQ348_002415 [Seirophora lacunosa]